MFQEANKAGEGMAGYDNIKEHGFDKRTAEEQRQIASLGGKASGKARRAKKTMREAAKNLMEMELQEGNVKRALDAMGYDKDDQTYLTAVVVRLVAKATDGDVAAIRLLGELTGDFTSNGNVVDDIIEGEIAYPTINIPDNGRDERNARELAPQAGPQMQFMTSSADIVIYGGAAGGGKTYALLLEALRHKDVPGFGAVIFRHNYNQITAQGGLWDASLKMFGQVPDAHPGKSPKLHWQFDSGGRLNFAHIDREEDLSSWQGTEIAYIGFDELTHFSRHQFLYMLSRNRSTCGIRPYVRATCNPDADSWVADFISWWIDEDTGYPIPERSGRIRWMCTVNDTIHMADDPKELVEEYGVDEDQCKSVTFIASRLENNRVLMESDPGYMANLKALPLVEMERLLHGNWKIRPAAGMFFKRSQVTMLETVPNDIQMWCRAWDIAASEEDKHGDPDYTAGVLMGIRKDRTVVVLDVINQRIKAGDVEKLIYNTALVDRNRYGHRCKIRIPQDPGAAGKIVASTYVKKLTGFSVKALPVSGSKELRATPLAAQWQNGNVQVLLASWNDEYFTQMEAFPESKHDDMVDASSDAFTELTGSSFNLKSLI